MQKAYIPPPRICKSQEKGSHSQTSFSDGKVKEKGTFRPKLGRQEEKEEEAAAANDDEEGNEEGDEDEDE